MRFSGQAARTARTRARSSASNGRNGAVAVGGHNPSTSSAHFSGRLGGRTMMRLDVLPAVFRSLGTGLVVGSPGTLTAALVPAGLANGSIQPAANRYLNPQVRRRIVQLRVLAVSDCPNAAVLERRLSLVLAGRSDVVLMHEVVDDAAAAMRAGMAGSPTLLVDGVDPFAMPGQVASVSCRLYRDQQGRVTGAPSVAQLRAVLSPQPPPDRTGRTRK